MTTGRHRSSIEIAKDAIRDLNLYIVSLQEGYTNTNRVEYQDMIRQCENYKIELEANIKLLENTLKRG